MFINYFTNTQQLSSDYHSNSIKLINLLSKDGIVTDSLYFNWLDYDIKGIPENTKFAVRFMSDRPFVVSGNKTAKSYHI